MALITIDLRFLTSYDDELVYGEDWELAITVGTSLEIGDVNSVVLPEAFLLDSYNKSQVHEFLLTAWEDIQFKVDVILLNDTYLNLKYAFINSTSVEIVSPYRAEYGQHKTFYAIITQDEEVSLPINVPELSDSGSFPSYWLDLGSLRYDESTLTKRTLEMGVNEFEPKSLYWESQTYTAMPYLPFFSNCKGFDQHIPIFALFEQNKKCDLVAPEDTVYVKPFAFGSEPIADSCEAIQISCIYDEDLGANSDDPRWFEPGPSILFYLTKNPQSASSINSENVNLKTSNFIPVTVTGEYEDSKIPSLVKVEFNYYQVSKTEKRFHS